MSRLIRTSLAFLTATAIAAAVGIAPFLPAKPQVQTRPPRSIGPPQLGTITWTSTDDCKANGCGPHMIWHPAVQPGEDVMAGEGWRVRMGDGH